MITTEIEVSNIDVQHALSEKYGPKFYGVLKLDSGRIAVFAPASRELSAIVDTIDEIWQVDITTSTTLQKELRWRRENRRVPLKVKREQPAYKPPVYDKEAFAIRMAAWKAKKK